jgi:hypothetical protein
MTVGELIKELQALPQDMEIMVISGEYHQDPVDITDITVVSRGRWTAGGLDLVDGDYVDFDDENRFVQDDEGGTVAVLVTW